MQTVETVTTSPEVKPLYRGTQIVWYVLNLVEVLLLLRFVLKLLGANPAAGFSHFIYSITYLFASPFLNVFRINQIEGSTIEWSTLLAMAVYWMIAWGVVRLIVMGKPVSSLEASTKLNKQDATS